MRYLLVLLFITANSSFYAQEVKRINFEQLEAIINTKDEKTYVINFWATWCIPCVEELPYFEQLDASHAAKNVKVLLVSLDFIDKIESRLIPFLKKNKIKSEVVVLDAPNENEWIPKINEQWSGAIPATLFVKGEKRLFFEKSFTKESLNYTLKQFL